MSSWGKHTLVSPPQINPVGSSWTNTEAGGGGGGGACGLYIFKVKHQCCVCMTCNMPTPGHPSAADDA